MDLPAGTEETLDEEVVSGEAGDPKRHKPRALHEPGTPSDKEIKGHSLTHLPYKSRYWICRGARGYTRAPAFA